MFISKIIFSKIIPYLISLFGIQKDSWNFKKISVFIQSMIMLPIKRIKRARRTAAFVEKQYDEISGLYIHDNYYSTRERYSVVNGRIQKISIADNVKLIRKEIRDILKEYNFNNILEIGAGELTTLEDIYKFKNGKINCYGIDLSLNRLVHGVTEFKKKHTKTPIIAKADATNLPFPDDSFDLVITRHALEQMPKTFKYAIDEALRVAKKHIIFFEPSFELGSLTQKLKMLNSDYVKGIPRYLSIKNNLHVEKTYLMKNSANPLNHTSCTKIKIQDKLISKPDAEIIKFICPLTKEKLKKYNDFLYAPLSKTAYPIINNIPILDSNNSFKLSKV